MRKIIEKTKDSLVEIEYTSEEEKFDIIRVSPLISYNPNKIEDYNLFYWPTNKTNYLTIGAYGVYNLTRHDIQDLTIRSITIYFTETNSKWLTKNPWPIIVDVVYSEEEYKFIEATTPDTNNSDPINDSSK